MKGTQINIINLEITLLRVVIKQRNLQHSLCFHAQHPSGSIMPVFPSELVA